MNEIEIETKALSINTMSVTIESLHVNSKQMTLAVFRQIPIRDEDEKSQLWGIVRYSIKDQGDVWLVFSNDGKLMKRSLNLYRQRIYDPEEKSRRESINRMIDNYNDKIKSLNINKDALKKHEDEQNYKDLDWYKGQIKRLEAEIQDKHSEIQNANASLNKEIENYKNDSIKENNRYFREIQLAQLKQLFIAV